MPESKKQPASTLRGLAAKTLLALLSPVLFLLLAEGFLRTSGLGYPTSFLLPVNIAGEPYWTSNPFYGYRFFHPLIARNPSPISVKQEKKDGTIRVIVLGESAAQGDPMLDYGMPRMLEKLLNEQAVASRYEVINAAMTAINSHVIVDIARDVLAAKPDIAVIYMGNNEVIGPYGPGTTFTAGKAANMLAPLRIKLTRLRLSQAALLLRRAPARGWSGLDMFKDLHLKQDDPSLAVMYRQFERNLERIIRNLQQNGTRVIVSTVAVNLADCPPFGGEGGAAMDRYRKGVEYEQQGDFEAARDAFKMARDLDTQRFRTDSKQNGIIRESARRANTELVDAEVLFDTVTKNGRPPGDELFLDHVHFTFEGTWQISRLIAAAILGTTPERMASLERSRELMFFTPWAERNQALIMLERRNQPPLSNQSNNQEQSIQLSETVRACADQIQQLDVRMIEAEFRKRYDESPDDFFLPFSWGAILMDHYRWHDAATILTNAMVRLPLHAETRMLPAMALAKSGRPEEAARVMAGASKQHGYYLAEYGAVVMRNLRRDGYESESETFRNALLQIVPRFVGQEQFEQ